MSGHRKWSEIRAQRDSPAHLARVATEKRIMGAIMTLHELREQLGISQQDLARVWETSQPNVSKIEHQDDLLLSTIRRYVEALGGSLEMQAIFADKSIRLHLGEPQRDAEAVRESQVVPAASSRL